MGDRRELRAALRIRSGNRLPGFGVGRRGRWGVIKTATAKDPLTEEASPDPSPLEDLLA